MSAPQNSDELFQLVRKSGLIEEAKLATFLKSHQRDGLLLQDARNIVAAMVREGLITYFQGEQYLLGKWRGFTLGKFKLLERIGVGGMGQVFLCEHTFMRKRLAVKVLPPSKAEDPVSLGRFYREARVASGLDHKHIVRTYDIDQDGPLHFLVMEYVDGTSLLEIVKKHGPMNVVRACHYIKMACQGLQHAFTTGMIHRDIKPGNIMVDRQGNAKLLDMGLARFSRDEKDQLTLKYDDKNVLGTADYVAPEQTRDSRNIDIRADIYGMGATFYYILVGQPPFPEPTVAEKLIAHQTKKPRPIRELRPDIPSGVAKIIERMMAKDPKDRYQTPQEVVDALEVWTEQPIDPPPASEMPRLSPAAMDPSYSPPAPVVPAGPTRDAATVRPEEAMPTRSVSSPILQLPDLSSMPLRAIEEGRTIPTPPAPRPAVAGASVDHAVPSAQRSAPVPVGGSVVDLTAPPGPRPTVVATETRALQADPTPQPAARVNPPMSFGFDPPPRVPPAPKPSAPLDLEHSGHTVPLPPGGFTGKLTLPPLRPSAMGTTKPLPSSSAMGTTRPNPPAAPAAPPAQPTPPAMPMPPAPPPTMSRPSVELPKLRSFHGIALPEPPGLSVSATPGVPMRPPLPPAESPPRPPSLDAFRVKLPDSHRPAAKSFVAPLAPPVLNSVSHTPRPLPTGSSSLQPAYKPPTMMPFFDQPIVPTRPNLVIRLMRWLIMILFSTIIGAALGVGIWYQFLRRVE